ncbi:alpha-keto acid decarboxylase family protein [Bacillus daqingensis]|uniref:Alpha-keto-acid decarboxylase n=1 Tax=Bacillus daqingensis TaxID=872396 RepID=A0ABV9NX61_9BACI
MTTIAKLVFDCLRDAGVTTVFGVPGDYNFALYDELETREDIRMITNRNELNAGYAADGYARVKGAGAILTAFGVGDLSAMNATAGAFSEQVPIIHIAGSPDSAAHEEGKLVHHTLMNGDLDVFRRMHENVTVRAVRITEANAAEEIPLAVQQAVEKRLPVYIDIPQDVAEATIELPEPLAGTEQEAINSEWAADAIYKALSETDRAVLLVDLLTSRYFLEDAVIAFSRHYQLPTAQSMQAKSAFPESDPQYIGTYGGQFGEEDVTSFIEKAEVIVTAGLLLSDFNTAKFTAALPEEKRIDLYHDHVVIFGDIIEEAPIIRVLEELMKKEKLAFHQKPPQQKEKLTFTDDDPLQTDIYYQLLAEAIKSGDVVSVDTGTLSYGMPYVPLNGNVRMIAQGSWQSIGYALPAALGAAAAGRDGHTWCLIGDGAAQLTIQELSTFTAEDLDVTVILLNNKGYTVERKLHPPRPDASYNDIPEWDYEKLVQGFAPDFTYASVKTAGDLQKVLQSGEKKRFIELIVEDWTDAPMHLNKLNETLRS